MIVTRRRLLGFGSAAVLGTACGTITRNALPRPASGEGIAPVGADGPADYTLHIRTGRVELGKAVTVSTRTYDGGFPGPLLRLTEGKRVVVDVHNETDTPELLHWHGQTLPAELDGAAEQGSPYIPPRGMQRIAFVPGPSGFRFYHTHMRAGADLSLGLYNGEAGPVYIEPRHDPGAYDREAFLTLKEFGPRLERNEMMPSFLTPARTVPALHAASKAAQRASEKLGRPEGYNVAYQYFTINGRMLGHGEPIRVARGDRVLFHVLNASATEIRSLTLPGHVFEVVALDGNPVLSRTKVPVLWLGPAERVSALVEMTHPGVWVMGDLADADRARGMGVVVEYAGAKSHPQWHAPTHHRWDYRRFGAHDRTASEPDETLTLMIGSNSGARDGFDEYTINGVAFSMDDMTPMFRLARGRRYRLQLRNATDDIHPVHLHRQSFEITSIAGMPTAGVVKDVAMIGAYQEMTIDFTAEQPGLSLFHCHMQHHMDYGFMMLFECA